MSLDEKKIAEIDANVNSLINGRGAVDNNTPYLMEPTQYDYQMIPETEQSNSLATTLFGQSKPVEENSDVTQQLFDIQQNGENYVPNNFDFDAATKRFNDKLDAYKKYRVNDEDTLLEAKKISEATGIPENLVLSSAETFAEAREIYANQQKNVDMDVLFKENPALAKLAVNGNDTMAAIAMHHIPEIKEQKSIIQNFVDGLRRAELQKELTHIGDMERSGGARIDEGRVKAIYEELEKLKGPSIGEDFIGAVVGGTAEQLPQMGRGAYQAAYRGLQGALVGGGYGAIAGGGIASGVTATGAALTMGSMAARYGWFEQSYNEMAGSNYVALRMMKDKNGNAIYTPEQANNIAVAQAAVSAGIESFNVGNILGRMGNAKGIFAKEIKGILTKASSKEAGFAAMGQWLKHQSVNAAKTTLEESGEEAVQSVSDNLIQNLGSYVYNKDNYVGAGEMVKDAAENFIAAVPASFGFGVAGAMGAATSGSVRRMARALQIENQYKFSETKTGQGIQLLNTLKQHLASSELFKKDPETAKAVLKENLEGSGFDNVYIDTAEMRQAGQTELLTQVVNTLDLSDETKQNIIAGNEELNTSVTLYQLATADIDEKLNEYISFDANDMSFAKNKRFAETIRDEMKVLREQDQQEEKAITDIILENAFAPEDREAAAQYLQDVGLRNASRQLNTDLKAVNSKIQEIIERNGPTGEIIDVDRSYAYYVKGKGWGWYRDSDKNIVPQESIGTDIQTEINTRWEWEKLDDKIEPYWLTRWRNNNFGRFTKAASNQLVIDSILGNVDYGIWDVAPENLAADRETLQSLLEEKARLEKLQAGFGNVANNEDIVARGLSKEGYQVYKNVIEQLKNASTAEAREAAQFNAILLARHADRYAAIVREFTDNKEYTALDYMQNLVVDAKGEMLQEGSLNQWSFSLDDKGALEKFADQLTYEDLPIAKIEDGFYEKLKGMSKEELVADAERYLTDQKNKRIVDPLGNVMYFAPGNTETIHMYAVHLLAGLEASKMDDISKVEAGRSLGMYLASRTLSDPFTIIEEDNGRRMYVAIYADKINYANSIVVGVEENQNGRIVTTMIAGKTKDKKAALRELKNRLSGERTSQVLYIRKGLSGYSRPSSGNQASQRSTSLSSTGNSIIAQNIDVDNTLNQNAKGQIHFGSNKTIISLLQTADQSTFAHEMGHLFLRDLEQLAKMEGCPELIKKDWETVKQWTEWKPSSLDEYKGTSLYGTYDDKGKFVPGEFNLLNAQIKQAIDEGNTAEVERLKYKWAQERWARGWEEYLRQGKAPTSGLRQVFRTFKKWLCGIYKDFLQVGGAPSPEVKAVMDRMIASQEEIEIEAMRSSHNSFIRAGGLNFLADSNQEMFEKYWAQAQEEAAEEVLKQAMKDVTEDYAKQRQEYLDSVRADAKEESYDNPVFLIQEEVAEAEDKENTLAGLLQMAQMTKEEYEAELKKYGGSREGYVNAKVAEEAKLFDENPLTAENIKANAQDAINRGEYSDLLNEFELAAMIQKGQIEQRIGKMADKKFAEIEKALSGIDASEGAVEKISALQQRINDLLYTIRWNDAEKKMLMDLQEAAAQAKLEAEVLSHKADVKELKSKLQDIRKELKHSEKEKEYNLRWAEAEKNILLDMQKAEDEARRKADVAEAKATTKAETEARMQAKMDAQKQKLEHKIDEAEYNARWREAELNFIIDEFKGKLQDKIEDFNQYRKETRTGLKVVRDANKGLIKRFREYVKEDNKSLPLEESANERYWRKKAEEASREMYASLKNEEYEQAAYYKQVELINNIRATEARKNQKLMDKVETRLKQKLKTLKKRDHVAANQRYIYQTIMQSFGLAPEAEYQAPSDFPGVQNVLAEMIVNGYEMPFNTLPGVDMVERDENGNITNINTPQWLNAAMAGTKQDKGIKGLTEPQLRDLNNFMNMVYKSGSKQMVLDKDGNKLEVNAVAEQIRAEANERMAKIQDVGNKRAHQKLSAIQKAARLARAGHARVLQIETLLDMMGPLAHNVIYDRIGDAAMKELRMLGEINKKLSDLIKTTLNINGKEFLNNKYRFGNELIEGSELLTIALNCGTESNRSRIFSSFNVTEEQLNEALGNLTENEWKFVQGVWDMFEENWPQVADVQIAITGGMAKKEPAKSFAIRDKNGVVHEIKGGYYPIRYDSTQSTRTQQLEASNNIRATSGTMAAKNVNTSFTKERAEAVSDQVLNTNLNLISSMLTEQVHFITMRQAFLDARAIMYNKEFENAVTEQFGSDALAVMQKWVNDQWASANTSTGWASADAICRWARTSMTMGALSWRATTAFINFANAATCSNYIGAGNFVKALNSFYSLNWADMKAKTEFIYGKSVFVAQRAEVFDANIREMLAESMNIGKKDKVKSIVNKMTMWGFKPIMLTDMMFALPMWQYEYERVMREADFSTRTFEQVEADAVRAGDAAVRKCFGSGMKQDQNDYQRGNELTKTLTTFYSYFAVVHNMVASKVAEGRRIGYQGGDWMQKMAPIAGTVFYMYLMQSIIDAGLREFLNSLRSDDEWDWERFGKKSFSNVFDNMFGAIPVARDGVPRLLEKILGERMTDVRLPVFDTFAKIGNIYDAVTNDKKDKIDVTYEVMRFISLMTGVSDPMLNSIPTTLRYFDDMEKYELGDYILSVLLDKRLKKKS